MSHETSSRADSDRRAAGEQNLLEREWAVLVIGWVGACPRTAGCLEEFFAAILAEVNLDVLLEELRQVFEQLWAMSVLGVDQ